MENGKIIKLLTHLLEITSKNAEKLDSLENKFNLLSKESKKISLAKKIVDDKRYITKAELQEKLGLKTWRSWQTILLGFVGDKDYNIHTGIGKSPTMIVSLKNHNSAISLASKIFKEMKKGQQIDIVSLKNKFGKDENFCKELINMILTIFPKRTEKSKMLPLAVKKLY